MACCTVTPDYSQRPTDCITQVSPAVIQSVVESRVEDGRLTNSNDQVCQCSVFTDMTAIATVIALYNTVARWDQVKRTAPEVV